MKRLLLKLTTENTFMLNSNFCKQIDDCAMGGPLSVIFSDTYMTKAEEEVVKPTRVFFTDTDDSQDSRRRAGIIFYSTLPPPSAH